MSDLLWVSQAEAGGVFDVAGGLNFLTQQGAPSRLPPGRCSLLPPRTQRHGRNIPRLPPNDQSTLLNAVHRHHHRSGGRKFTLNGFLENVQSTDLERLMNAGSLEAVVGESFLNSIDLSGLPPADLTVEIVLPNWATTVDGTSTIVLTKSIESSSSLDLSLTGLNPYDWEHEITNDDGRVVCYANQSTCVESDVKFDLSKVNFNEWSASISVTDGTRGEIEHLSGGFRGRPTLPQRHGHPRAVKWKRSPRICCASSSTSQAAWTTRWAPPLNCRGAPTRTSRSTSTTATIWNLKQPGRR